jgi:hypothetical protein
VCQRFALSSIKGILQLIEGGKSLGIISERRLLRSASHVSAASSFAVVEKPRTKRPKKLKNPKRLYKQDEVVETAW